MVNYSEIFLTRCRIVRSTHRVLGQTTPGPTPQSGTNCTNPWDRDGCTYVYPFRKRLGQREPWFEHFHSEIFVIYSVIFRSNWDFL